MIINDSLILFTEFFCYFFDFKINFQYNIIFHCNFFSVRRKRFFECFSKYFFLLLHHCGNAFVVIFVRNYESLLMQIEIDYDNLKMSFEKYKKNTSDQKLLSELCQNYAFLFQDIEYFEKLNMIFSGVERQVSGKFLIDLGKIKMFLREIKELFLRTE